ncbi:MAG: hypothetical protein CMJ18_01830 [Phycisphaeraceae bacterium]|nr:hypothetical protein [Phycisphaeraceae bacterium]
MKRLRYLNIVLTWIAVLLTLQLWTTWMGTDVATPAHAAGRTPGGIINAGQQRKQIKDELKRLNQRADELVRLFKSGKARVKVTGKSVDSKN